jgi:hypothetical protein
VARRERNRRNQFMFAIVLLLAVIVLAGVLVFVLLSGDGNAPGADVKPISQRRSHWSLGEAVATDRSFNARGAVVAIS